MKVIITWLIFIVLKWNGSKIIFHYSDTHHFIRFICGQRSILSRLFSAEQSIENALVSLRCIEGIQRTQPSLVEKSAGEKNDDELGTKKLPAKMNRKFLEGTEFLMSEKLYYLFIR